MVPVIIETLVVGMQPSPSVVVLRPYLKDQEKIRLLPIWIGPTEAISIGMALEGAKFRRPTTHDLTVDLLLATGATVERVEVDRVEGSTFYASIVLKRNEETIRVDARPSDAIAIAVRTKATIFVAEEIFENAALPDFLAQFGNDRTPEQIEKELGEFKNFVEGLSPEDFTV